MSVHHLPLPARLPAPPPSPQPGARAFTYGLDNLARRLGLEGKADRTVIAYLRVLILHQSFPLPFPRRVGTDLRNGADALHAHARWDRRGVDAWFDGLLPPGARAALDNAAATNLDDRADNLDALLQRRRRG